MVAEIDPLTGEPMPGTTQASERKYYLMGSTTIAMREIEGENDSLYWLVSDHLNSTSITASSTGQILSEVRYSAFGEIRYRNNTTPTDRLYTGQRAEAELGLYYYVARWYDPSLNRFIQPDSIVPDPYNSQDWDPYAYTRNNPILYNDPSGHFLCLGFSGAGGYCGSGTNNPGFSQETMQEYGNMVKANPRILSIVSIFDYHEGKVAYNVFTQNPGLAEMHAQANTKVWTNARFYSQHTPNKPLDLDPFFFIEPNDGNSGYGLLGKILALSAISPILEQLKSTYGLDKAGLNAERQLVLSTGQQFSGKHFPLYSTSEYLYKFDSNKGIITAYARYLPNKEVIYRVEIDNPKSGTHQQFARWNNAPGGRYLMIGGKTEYPMIYSINWSSTMAKYKIPPENIHERHPENLEN